MNEIKELAYQKYIVDGYISPALLCRRYKINISMAKIICDWVWMKHFMSRFEVVNG